MTATRTRPTTARHAELPTALLGTLTLVAGDEHLTGVYFAGHWTRPDRTGFGPLVAADADPLLGRVAAQLTEYLAGARREFDLPVRADGDEDQQRVWAQLRTIPYGTTITYGELAERLGDRRRAWSVGQAVGRNPLSLVVPCHRVVGRDGRLTGYAGGLTRKRRLLDLEEPRPARLF